MRRPVALRSYLALLRAQRGGGQAALYDGPRPDGPLIWAHGGTVETQRALAAILRRMAVTRPELHLLLSGPDDAPAPLHPVAVPDESWAKAQSFARHWRPDVVLWADPVLRPALFCALSDQGARMVMLATSTAPIEPETLRWIPEIDAAALGLFDLILASDPNVRRHVQRVAAPQVRIELGGPLSEMDPPLECAEGLHEEMAGLLAGRPVWLAARLRQGEADTILRAHRRALRLAHRLLLILVPDTATTAANMADEAKASGLRLAYWEEGDMPDENTQVLVVEGPWELGLWYRLAPLAFMGGSLVPGFGGSDPYEAAALGAATLYGPNVGLHLPAYSQLAEAGAARIVKDTDSLAAAVSHLIAPDRAAAMANAGWDIVTAGAAMTDLVIERSFELLDQTEAV